MIARKQRRAILISARFVVTINASISIAIRVYYIIADAHLASATLMHTHV